MLAFFVFVTLSVFTFGSFFLLLYAELVSAKFSIVMKSILAIPSIAKNMLSQVTIPVPRFRIEYLSFNQVFAS